MSKVSRQTAKQNRSTNRQNNAQTAKEDQTLKATTDQTSKPVQAGNKQAVDPSTRQGPSAGRQLTRQAAKYERRREEQRRREEEKQQAVQRKRLAIVGGIIATVLVVGIIVGYFVYTSTTHQGSTQSNTVPQSANLAYPVIDGVPCDTTTHDNEYHIHAHLSIYMNGQQIQQPGQIGIPADQSCLYWLHTHKPDGIIHMEAPAGRSFTLGTFLDVWGQEFSSLKFPTELDLSTAPGWHVYVDGKPYNGDFRAIPLKAHTLITLAYNSPNVQPDTTYNWGDL